MGVTGKRTVGGGYSLEAHKDAWVLHKVYKGIGEGSLASIYRKMKIKYAVRDYTTIYDWSARARCTCPYHKWEELDEKVERGEFAAPTQEELKEALSLGGKLYVANTAYNESLDALHMLMLQLLTRKFQPDEQGNFPEVKLDHATIALMRQLTEWVQVRSSVIATDVDGGEVGAPRVSGADGEAISVGVTMPAELMMEETPSLETVSAPQPETVSVPQPENRTFVPMVNTEIALEGGQTSTEPPA